MKKKHLSDNNRGIKYEEEITKEKIEVTKQL